MIGSGDAFDLAGAAAGEIARRTGVARHEIAVVLGSGTQEAVDLLGTARAEFDAGELPGFAEPTVAGHHGRIRSTLVGGRDVLVFVGRVHLYEGHSPAAVVHPVRAAVLAGASTVVLTNAAGSLDPTLGPGRAVLLRDHLNLTGRSPLAGAPPPAAFGSRFVDLSEVYAPALRALARRVDPDVREGVYAGFPGPHYETPAEIKMVRRAGGDLVGMSTVLEAIAARHLSAAVLGISLVTNLAAGVGGAPLEHGEVLERARASAPGLIRLVRGVLEAM